MDTTFSADTAAQLFGAAVRVARIRSGWTQEHLASLVGVDPKTVGSLERGEKDPLLSTVTRFAQVLELPLSQVLALSQEQSLEDARALLRRGLLYYFRDFRESYNVGLLELARYTSGLQFLADVRNSGVSITNARVRTWLDQTLISCAAIATQYDLLEPLCCFCSSLGEAPDIAGLMAATELTDKAKKFFREPGWRVVTNPSELKSVLHHAQKSSPFRPNSIEDIDFRQDRAGKIVLSDPALLSSEDVELLNIGISSVRGHFAVGLIEILLQTLESLW